MLDRTSSPSKALLRDCRRDVLCLAGARLLAEMTAPPEDDRFPVMRSNTTLVAPSALSSSREAAWLDHVQDALKAISTRRKSQAIENAIAIVSAALGSTTADDDPPGPDDPRPRGGALGDGISLRHLWSLSNVQAVGKALDNCLAYTPAWGRRHQPGEAANYAVEDGAEATGTIAVGRDLTGALSIIEQGGPCNAPLPVVVQRAVQKWIGQATAGASKSA
jgi:hypothetical protein